MYPRARVGGINGFQKEPIVSSDLDHKSSAREN